MISKIVHATSCTVKCPICGKSMLLKNWKDHCRQFHAMSQTAIDCKYYELKRNIKQSNLSTVTLDTTTNSENPNSMPINTLFSMKKFVLVKSTITNENTQAANVNNQVNQSQLMEIDSQNTHLDTPINYIELEPLPIISDSYLSLNENDISCSNHESCNLIVSTPSSSKILLQINEIFRNGNDEISNNSNRVQLNDIQLHYETIAEDKESEGKETDNNLISTPASTKNIGRLTSSRSLIMSKHIEGVKFITSNEVTFIDTQRKNHPSINWHTDDKQKQVKPSRAWFSKNFQWVRAVCTDNRYGLICVDCDEYARDKTLIERNKGAFVVRPYWKLKHKGLDGIKNHQNSDLHRASREKRIATKIVANIGNIIGQLNCVNLENQTKKYVEKNTGVIKEEIFKLGPIRDARGHSIPNPSETRWSYSFEIVRFACQHYSAIIMTFTTISQSKSVGSSDGRRYVMDLMKPLIVFQIHLLRDVLRSAMEFLRQIGKRGLCLDEFAVNFDAARATISQAMNAFDFVTYKATLSNIKQYAPLTKLTSHSTRGQQQSANIDFDECELKTTGDEFVQNVLESLDDRFNGEAKQMIQDLCTFSSPSNLSPEELISNSLIQKYTSPITYIHKSVDEKVYERTDQPLLNIKFLKNDVYAFLKIVQNISSIPSILLRLAKLGSEQCPEWFRLYQILATFAVGSNEAERMFSILRRIKSWLRNRLNDTTIEILLKLSSLNIQLTDDGIDFIIQDFIKSPGRAKSRNVTLFFESDQLKQKDDEF
ncbi:unnamed protein product [Rotaria socialis]|uniref:Uncharacterized protein n=1 Tax=Rotaria socialis TaxID=392032 RepID=A0A818V9X5_9BILA|nr:unnamed protein product [Rotaria socialis]